MRQKGIPVPQIYDWDERHGFFILEDMGDINLQAHITSANNIFETYLKVLAQLFHMQTYGAKDFDTNWCCQTTTYDLTVMIRYESFYFRSAFLKLYLDYHPKNQSFLEKSFKYLASKASEASTGFLLHRDFQSRNIMVTAERFGILDWQGARLGPLGYDLASLIIDPYTNLPKQIKERLLEKYLQMVNDVNKQWSDEVRATYPYLALQRNLQILGAFSYLTKVKGKLYFEQYIPKAFATLKEHLGQISDNGLAPLTDLVHELYSRVSICQQC